MTTAIIYDLCNVLVSINVEWIAPAARRSGIYRFDWKTTI